MNRFDSSQFGRFMSTDSVAGSMNTPQSLNRYAHVGDDPVNYADPSGLLMIPACEWDRSCGGGDEGGWSPPGGQGAGIQACGVDSYCIGNGGIGPFGSPLAQIHCDSNGCMTGSWQFSQYNVGGTISVDWGAQKAAEYEQALNAFHQQEEAVAAALGITVEKLRETYSTTPVLGGGNWNFSTAELAALGVSLPDCSQDRCGSIPSLDFSHAGWVHLDTANVWWGYGSGATIHLFVDLILGNTFFASGIPR